MNEEKPLFINQDNIPDETPVVRFLDLNGAEKSIGSSQFGAPTYTIHFGRLSYYREIENKAGDAKEGSTSIDLGDDRIGSNTTVNDARVSCWSILPEGHINPFDYFKDCELSKEETRICAIVSTVGKIKKVIQNIIEIDQEVYKKTPSFLGLIIAKVIYYPRECGVDLNTWRALTDAEKNSISAALILNLVYKRDSNEKGQRYDTEQELRIALPLAKRRFFANDKKTAIDAEDVPLYNYKLVSIEGRHYIEKAYFRFPTVKEEDLDTLRRLVPNCPSIQAYIASESSNLDKLEMIEANCRMMGIEVIKAF